MKDSTKQQDIDRDPVDVVVMPQDREKAFRDAIAKVCAEHGAELEVTDDGKPYGTHSGVMRVTMMSVWDGDQLVKDFCQFDW